MGISLSNKLISETRFSPKKEKIKMKNLILVVVVALIVVSFSDAEDCKTKAGSNCAFPFDLYGKTYTKCKALQNGKYGCPTATTHVLGKDYPIGGLKECSDDCPKEGGAKKRSAENNNFIYVA